MKTPDWTSHDGMITLYRDDCRSVLSEIEAADAVITDPVWPNASVAIPGSDNPYKLFKSTAYYFPDICARAVIHLGCDSDPRFLNGMPDEMPFLRACWLRYARPNYKGRLLNGADVAYVFGEWPPSRKGGRVLPGEVCHTKSEKRFPGHPCPRRDTHVEWLVHWFGGNSVIDPFMGSGTTAIACLRMGVRFAGMEVSEEYFDTAVMRIESEMNKPRMQFGT